MITAKQKEGQVQPVTDLKIPDGLCDKFLGCLWVNGYKQECRNVHIIDGLFGHWLLQSQSPRTTTWLLVIINEYF